MSQTSPASALVATVQSDLTSINTQTNSLDASIVAFPNSNGTLVEALAVHDAAVKLDNTLTDAITHADASAAFSEPDGNATLNLIRTVVPNIQQALSDLVNKKAAVANLPVSEIIQQDLQALKNHADGLIAAYLAKTPATLVTAAQGQATLVSNAFNNAIAVYQ